ncbi:BMA-AVR-14, isoform d [Aphelenchoides fujianensis]|nr:BMA-AVR-14, isoform d [Aphelenchoides fujianensis]
MNACAARLHVPAVALLIPAPCTSIRMVAPISAPTLLTAIAVWAFCCAPTVAQKAKKKLKEQDIIQRVLKDYDWRVRPRGYNDSWPDTGGPVVVSVNIYLRSISKIDDVNMEYSAQFTFREEWWDARLAYERLSLVLSCPMSLEYYPLDYQTCLIDLASYAYTTDDIKYEWKAENPIQKKLGLEQSLPSFELQDDINGQQRMPRFRAQSVDTQGQYQLKLGGAAGGPQEPLFRNNHPNDGSYHNLIVSSGTHHHGQQPNSSLFTFYSCCCRIFVRRYKERSKRIDVVSRLVFPIGYACFNGEYSCARVKLMLRREYSYYLIQLYIPCVMLVVVSFWLDKDAVPARYALVNYYGRREFMKKERSKKGGLQQVVAQLPSLMSPDCLCPPSAVHPDAYMNALQTNNNNAASRLNAHRQSMRLDLSLYGHRSLKSRLKALLGENSEVSKRVDLVSRFAFPALFGLFLAFYYLKYVFAFKAEQQ